MRTPFEVYEDAARGLEHQSKLTELRAEVGLRNTTWHADKVTKARAVYEVAKSKLRVYLETNTPRSSLPIHDGVRGEFSKVSEEYLELADAIQQQNRSLTFIEGCDLVDAVVRFQAKQFWVPAPVVLALVYLRRLYKPIRNRVYDYVGLDKEFFNG